MEILFFSHRWRRGSCAGRFSCTGPRSSGPRGPRHRRGRSERQRGGVGPRCRARRAGTPSSSIEADDIATEAEKKESVCDAFGSVVFWRLRPLRSCRAAFRGWRSAFFRRALPWRGGKSTQVRRPQSRVTCRCRRRRLADPSSQTISSNIIRSCFIK